MPQKKSFGQKKLNFMHGLKSAIWLKSNRAGLNWSSFNYKPYCTIDLAFLILEKPSQHNSLLKEFKKI